MPMETVLWLILGAITVCTGFTAVIALIAMSTSKYRG